MVVLAMAKGGGTLHVTLVSATLSPLSPAQDSADSYATLTCGKQQFTTKVAQDQGILPTWNERHRFEIEDRDEFEFQELIIAIFAARSELNELLGIAKLPFCKVISVNEETSLYPLSLPNNGERGQVKVTLKWESQIGIPESGSDSGNERIQPSGPMYPPASTQPSLSAESYHEKQLYADASAPADAAASALAGLALSKEKQLSESIESSRQDESGSASNGTGQQSEAQVPYSTYQPLAWKRQNHPHQPPEIDTSSVGDSYPSYSTEAPGSSPSLPYLASPIGGVVTNGVDYSSPPQAYTHPPYEIISRMKDSLSVSLPPNAYPESDHEYPSPPAKHTTPNVDLQGGNKVERVSDDQVPFYSDIQCSQSEGYPPAFQAHETNAGYQSYPDFSPFSLSEKYPPTAPSYPPNVDFTTKQGTGSSPMYSAAPHAGVYAPECNVGYRSESSFPSSSHYDNSTRHSAGYPGCENAAEGKEKTKFSVNASSHGTSEEDVQGREKGFHGYEYAYPSEGYGQPYYPSPIYPQYGYPPQNIPHGYPPAGFPPQYAPQQYVAPGLGGLYPQHGHQLQFGVPPAYHVHPQQQVPYSHNGGHEGHYGGAKVGSHNGEHSYWQQGYGGHHSGGHGYGGY
ncbi:hypothetical protein R1flu_007499 [Riccia fluitans]|uniref:C2 domain-containing protein n=1 Tax=Riccia fluitans TaxID=41844 RepID=A0ABD1YZ16_9MARC